MSLSVGERSKENLSYEGSTCVAAALRKGDCYPRCPLIGSLELSAQRNFVLTMQHFGNSPAPRVAHIKHSPNAETDGLTASINVELRPDCRGGVNAETVLIVHTFVVAHPFSMPRRMRSI